MNYRIFLSLFFLGFACITESFCQNHDTIQDSAHESSAHHESHKKQLISASINHTVIFSAVKEGESASSITLPSFGLNYTYFFNEKWALGLHNDIILEDFVVKGDATRNEDGGHGNDETAVIERGTPISSCIMVIYKPVPYLGLMAGAGREFSSHEDFTVIRFGLEAPYHLPKNWELFGVLTYDINIGAYQSLTYGIGIGKLF